MSLITYYKLVSILVLLNNKFLDGYNLPLDLCESSVWHNFAFYTSFIDLPNLIMSILLCQHSDRQGHCYCSISDRIDPFILNN